MASDPLHVVQLTRASVVFMGLGEDSSKACNVDIELTLNHDGSRWTATLLTLSEVERLMQQWGDTGECLNGTYFQSDDAVITQKGGLQHFTELLEALVQTDQYRLVLQQVEEA